MFTEHAKEIFEKPIRIITSITTTVNKIIRK